MEYVNMSAMELLTVLSQIKDACEEYERIESTADAVVNKIINLVAPVDTTSAE